jgi:hypothetical protein
MSRSAVFYFGTAIFFVGLLLLALGVSKVIAQTFDAVTFAALISGIVLMTIGFRATRIPVQRGS